MKKIGLFYSIKTSNTASVAEQIKKAFGNRTAIDVICVEDAEETNFEAYDNIIAGVSTWFDGELPTYWDELVPELKGLNLKGKKVAIFGLGDQVNYPYNFVDGIGILAEVFKQSGADIVGLTSTKSYSFVQSGGLEGDQFLGLAIDVENQSDQTEKRIKSWTTQLKKEFS